MLLSQLIYRSTVKNNRDKGRGGKKKEKWEEKGTSKGKTNGWERKRRKRRS